jgi:hypothetical protein
MVGGWRAHRRRNHRMLHGFAMLGKPRLVEILRKAWVTEMNTFDILGELVSKVQCKPGWRFKLIDEDEALRLRITVTGPNSREPGNITVHHFFPVPTAAYNEKTWRRWIFEQCRNLENHELGEFFKIGDERPFLPLHGPGENPYTVHEFRDPVDALTNQEP